MKQESSYIGCGAKRKDKNSTIFVCTLFPFDMNDNISPYNTQKYCKTNPCQDCTKRATDFPNLCGTNLKLFKDFSLIVFRFRESHWNAWISKEQWNNIE